MKKIVVVSGSPRKDGNTMEMVKRIEVFAAQCRSDVMFKYIHLIDTDLKYCRGCCVCLTQGGRACPLKDDKEMLLEEMHQADGLIFASPGYAHMVSGLFKNFIDRFMYLDHIPELINKPTLIVSTVGGDGANGAPNFMKNNSFLWWGCDIIDTIGVAHAFYKLNEKYRDKMEKRLFKAATGMTDAIEHKRLKPPTFGQYMCFKLNQAELIISPTAMPFRTKVWNEKGWIRQDYYYKTRVNGLYKVIGSSMVLMMRLVFRMMLGKDAGEKMRVYLKEN